MREPVDASRRWIAIVVASFLPWIWFLLRWRGGRFEAVAVLLPVLVLMGIGVMCAVAVLRRRPAALLAAGSLAVFGLVTVVGPRLPQPGPAPLVPIRLAVANTYAENHSADAVVAALLATDADVEVAVEASDTVRERLEELDGDRPFATVDEQIVVRSRFPIQPLPDPPGVPARRILRVQVEGAGGPFVLYALHALNPRQESSFAAQLVWVDRLLSAAERETLPVVMAGDFNMSDRQLAYRRMTSELRDAMLVGRWGRSTYRDGPWGLLFLRIDHVFVTRDWCAQGGKRFDLPGSDHEGIAVNVGPCP